MKNIQGIIDIINSTEFTDNVEGLDVQYKIEISPLTPDRFRLEYIGNQFDSSAPRYTVGGELKVFNWNPEDSNDNVVGRRKGVFGYFNISLPLYKFFMQKAYDLLITKLSLDELILLDLESGSLVISLYRGSGGKPIKDFLSTGHSYQPSKHDQYINSDWQKYQRERFKVWG